MSTTDDARDDEPGEAESFDENFVEPPVRRSTYTPPPAFSGATPGAQDPAIHDDDELANALAEELSRTMTGSIPIVDAEASLAADDPYAALFGGPSTSAEPEPPVFEIPSFDERIPDAQPAPVFEIPETDSAPVFEIPVTEPAPEPPVFQVPVWEAPTSEPEPPVFQAPVFDPPVFEEPSAEAGSDTPPFEAPVYEMPSYEPPVAETPAYEVPAAETPSYDIPAFESPESSTPAWEPTAWEPTSSSTFVPDVPSATAPTAADSAGDAGINEFSTPEEQFAALQKLAGPAGRPWVPERRSMTDRDLMDVLESASGPLGSAGALAEIEKQLMLREEEAREYADWEQSMLAVGTPEALAAVEKVRPQFSGVVPAAPAPSSVAEPSAEPVATDPSADEAIPDAAAPVWEAPAAEAPVWEAPAAEAPAWEAPAAEAPAWELPATDAPVWEAPVDEAPAAETPVQETPVDMPTPASEPFVWEMPVWGSANDESAVTEQAPADIEPPVAEAPAWEAPSAAAPVWETPVAESPSWEQPAPTPQADEPAVEEDPFAAFLAFQERQTAEEAATAPPATFPFATPLTEPEPEPAFPQHTPETVAETPVSAEPIAEEPEPEPVVEQPPADQFWANHAWADEPAVPPEAAPEPELPAAWDAPAAPVTEPATHDVAPPEPWIVPPPVAESAPPPLIDPQAPAPVPADFVPPVFDPSQEVPTFGSLFEPEVEQAPATAAPEAAPAFDFGNAASADPPPPPQQQAEPASEFNFDDLLTGAPDPVDTVAQEPRPFVGSADSERSESVVTRDQTTPQPATADSVAAPEQDEELDGVDDVVAATSVSAVPLAATGSIAVTPQPAPVFRVETTALEPTPADRRVGNAARLFYLWFAANSSVVSIAFGAILLGVGMNLRQAIVATLAGVALSFVPLGFTTLAGKRSSQPTMVVSRAVFGVHGNIVPSLIAIVTRLFWGSALLWGLAASVASILVGAELDGGLGFAPIVVIGIVGGLVLAVVVGYFGYALIAKLQLIVSIVSAALMVGVVVLTWPIVDFSVAIGEPDGPWILIVTGAVLVFSFLGLLWANSGSDLARYQRSGTSGAAAMLSPAFGATLPSFLLIAYGAVLAASNPAVAKGFATNPLDTLGVLLPTWYPVPLIIAASLGLLSGVVVTLYSGGFALQSLGVRMPRQWSTVVVAVLVLAGAFLIAIVGVDLTGLFRDVATTLAVPVAAWLGIFAADVMIRSRPYDSPSLLSTGGVYPAVNWVNLSALPVITAIGFGFTSASLAGLDWQGYLFGVIGVPASDPLASSDIGVLGALVLGLLVPLVSGVPGIRKQETQPGSPN